MTINNYNLSIDGLSISYTSNGVNTFLSYDAKATCDLFQELHIIDAFDLDQNFEPVILGEREHDFEDAETGSIMWTTRPVFITWADYVSSSLFTQRQAELIAEQHLSAQAHKKIINRINTLLAPIEVPELELA